MIKFIEHSETKLKFVSYPVTTAIGYLAVLFFVLSFTCYFVCFSPIESSLYCHKSFLGRIDCQLQEKSLIDSQPTKIDIINLKKVDKYSFGSRDSRIRLRANPHPLLLNTIGYQKTYHFPSNPFSLVLFRLFNPVNWFAGVNYIQTIDNFIQGELNQKTLSIVQSFGWIDIIFLGFFFVLIPVLSVYSTIFWFFTTCLKITYELDRNNKTLIVHWKKILGQNIEKQYSFDRLKEVKLDTNYTTDFNRGRIILEFEPTYEHPIDEFANAERGAINFQIIKNFVDDCKLVSN